VEDSHRMPEKQSDILTKLVLALLLAQGLGQVSKRGSNYRLFENY